MGESEYGVRARAITFSGSTEYEIFTADPARLLVVLPGSPFAGTYTYKAYDQFGGTFQYTAPQGGVIEFYFARHGPLPALRWTVSGGTAGTTIYPMEMFVLPKG